MTSPFAKHFSIPEGEIYLNCAAQGPLTLEACKAIEGAAKDKQFPAFMDQTYGEAKTLAARKAVSRFIGFPEKNIALADSTSWGINTLVQGLPLRVGDEVLLCAGQFPSNVAPWEGLKSRGVIINKMPVTNYIFDVESFEKELTPKTKVVCLEWVHFVSGDRIPLREISEICEARNIFVVVDVTQGLGAIPFSMKELKPDAVVCSAYKWLLSPYGSGFAALSDRIISVLDAKFINWLSFEEVAWNGNLADCSYKLCSTAKRFDVFSHMGYLNVSGMTASMELLESLNVEEIYKYGRGLIAALDLNPEYFEPLNTGKEDRQSLIATFKLKKLNSDEVMQELKANHIYASIRQGYLRFAPFIYNNIDQMKKTSRVLNQFASSGKSSTTKPSKA